MTSVLVIDDEVALRVLTRVMLTRLGYQIAEAAEGSQGEAMAIEARPDIVLLDLMMPGQDGFTTCQNLRTRGFTGKIVFVSALADPNTIAKAAGFGADGYLEKPVTMGSLRTQLDSLLTPQAA